MQIDLYKSDESSQSLSNDLGLCHIRDRFFKRTPKELFNALVSTPQVLENIIYRQEIFRDLLFFANVNSFDSSRAQLQELYARHDDTVKHWKNTGGRFGRDEPMIYDHKELAQIATEFSQISAQIASSFASTRGRVCTLLKNYFAQFSMPDSDITRKWDGDRRILEQEEKPFFALVHHDTWSNELDYIAPMGIVLDGEQPLKQIESALSKGITTAKLVIDGTTYDVALTGSHFALKDKTERVKHPRKIFCDYEPFHDVFTHIRTSRKLLDSLHFYRDGIDMYKYFTGVGLPMCLPRMSDEIKLELTDFYPFFEDMDPTEYVLNSFRLDYSNPVALITGLNSGGKSTLIRSIGNLSSLGRSGCFIPAARATIPNFQDIFYLDIVGDDFSDRLSTFRNQSRTVANIIKRLPKNPHQLLLFNEPLSGTDNTTEQSGLLDSIRILAQLYHVPTLIESHCTDAGYQIKEHKQKFRGVKLIKFTKNKKGKPDYIVKTGVGQSEGKYILDEEGLTFQQLRREFLKKK